MRCSSPRRRAYLAEHSELPSSPEEVYSRWSDGSATLHDRGRESGQVGRVMNDLREMGVTGLEPDDEARIAEALVERHPDMPGHVARDVAVTYTTTAELVAQEDRRFNALQEQLGELEAEGDPRQASAADPASPEPALDLQALATRLRSEDLAPEEKAGVAATLEATLERHLGAEGMARLDEGDHSALEGVLPSVRDRMNVTYERLDLKRELSRERRLERDMDDDMGL